MTTYPPGTTGWGSLFRYILGGLLLIASAVNVFVVGERLLGAAGVMIALFIIFGKQRILRPAITRESGGIVCRYVPWYEKGIYVGLVFIPVMGILAIVLASRPDFSSMIGVFGIGLLAIAPLIVAKFLRGQRRCLLQITPTTLNVPLPNQSYAMSLIPRDRVQSIAPAREAVGFGSSNLLLSKITYAPVTADSQSPLSLSLGPAPASDAVWLTIEPANLLAALQAWRAGDPSDPKLIDHIEAVLRGSSAS